MSGNSGRKRRRRSRSTGAGGTAETARTDRTGKGKPPRLRAARERSRMLAGLLILAAVVAAALGYFVWESRRETLPADDDPPRLATVDLDVGGKRVIAEVAANDADRARGLMFRRKLRTDHGMLFVYEEPSRMAFWMRNTQIPLDIAFIDDDGVIVSIDSMRPFDTQTRHQPPRPVLYALEMVQGWFARNGVGVGDRVAIPSDARSPYLPDASAAGL